MQLNDATDLIKNAVTDNKYPSIWADLGCGNGLFSYALSDLLVSGSCIYAIDKIIKPHHELTANNIEIKFQQANFITDDLKLSNLDGILMANSLHYVKEKITFLSKMKQYLSQTGIFIIIEYDTLHANRWVPYPINFEQLKQLFAAIDYNDVAKIGERQSIYGTQNMFSCVAKS
jgi:trans-aconitate methyltransferase